MADADDRAQRAHLAELQRRLYRREATAADLERYVLLRDGLAAAAPPPAPPRPARPAGARPALIGGVLLAAVAICAAVVLLQPTASPSASRAGAASTSTTATPATGPSAQISERFTNDAAPAPASMTVEVSMDGGRVLGQRFTGSGGAIVPLVTGGAPLAGGRMGVSLRAADRTPVSWQAEGVAGQPFPEVVIAPERVTAGRTSTDTTTVRYPRAPPPRIWVRAPVGTAWTLTVAFSR